MANLSEIFIKKETLQILLDTLNKKTGDDAKGVKITIAQDDKSNDYGQNVSAFVAQSKEQREAKVKKFYVGNGKVFWTKGETPVGQKPSQEPEDPQGSVDDLPF